jgi:hypothetical protein
MQSKLLPNEKQWESAIAKRGGPDEARIFLTRVQARYDELVLQAHHYENKALRFHFEHNILPAIAAYSILLMDGLEKKTAMEIIDDLLEAGIESERRMYRFWGRFPFFFNMIKLMLWPMMKKQYPERWDIEWLDLGPDVTGLNCHACFYLDVLTEYGFSELTPHFCRLDELLAGEAASSVRFERTQTLANGGTICDFRYMRVN